MDAVQVALIVVVISTLGGITQATLAGRATRVAARQQAVQAETALLLKLQEQLVDMGLACNDYGFEIFEDGFFTDDGWAEKRRPLLQKLTTCHARALSTAHALPVVHPVRVTALAACDVAMSLAEQNTLRGEAKKINQAWEQNSPTILKAIELAGAAVRAEHVRLQDVTRNGLSHALRRGARALNRRRKRLSS